MEQFDKGYAQGCKQVIECVSKWLDEDTIESLKEKFSITEESIDD